MSALNPPASLEEVRALLESAREEKYRAFSASLLPGVDGILGVRLPFLRRLARAISVSPFCDRFLLAQPQSFEETMLLGFVIACAPLSFNDRLAHAARFVPRIDNWSVCDSFCISLKDVRAHRAQAFAFLSPYLQSSREFDIRFGAVMLLDHFVCPDYLPAALQQLSLAGTQAHYARMAVAWALQTFYASFPDEVEDFLAAGRVDAPTAALAVSKIAQSLKTTPDALARLRLRIPR